MRTVSFVGLVSIVCAVAVVGGCSELPMKSPAGPTPITQPSSTILTEAALASIPPPAFPTVSRPARVYVALKSPVYTMHGSPLASRYLLYEDGTFALQYASVNYPFFQYLGTYKEAAGVLVFDWEGCCGWGATATLSGDALTVEYSLNMQMSDFLNGVYVRTQ